MPIWVVAVAWACGGADRAELDAPLIPPKVHLDRWLWQYDGWEQIDHPVTRFRYTLPPEEHDTPSLDVFHAALGAGDRAAAHAAAMGVVEAVLDRTAREAEDVADLLREPVEYLEIEPSLGAVSDADLAAAFTGGRVAPGLLSRSAEVRGLDPTKADALLAAHPDHVRAGSLRWLALRDHTRTGIANGWSASEIAAATPPETRDALYEEIASWLRDFPDHPLTDVVRLHELRVRYLLGDGDGAWGVLLPMFERHPDRVADQMQFLLRQGVAPPQDLDLEALPLDLALALLPWATPDAERWDRLWAKASTLSEQERLLYVASGHESTFPSEPAAPSETWARLRLRALLASDRREEAWAQTERMRDDPTVGPVRAWIELTRGDWDTALREPGFDRTYLTWVLAPDEVLRGLVDDPELGRDARFALALRGHDERRGLRRGARLLEPVDPERAALWREGAPLSRRRDAEAELAWARWLVAHAGKVYGDLDQVWYRSLPITQPGQPLSRAPGLPLGPDEEWAATSAWLRSSFATWEALQAYAAWLDADPAERGDTPVMEVVREADVAYNALLNYGSWDHYAWAAIVVDSDAAKSIRRAGKAARATP
ncbi:MAG: hypothetical protein KC621_18425 [Myxococcales bacterium]|nr:hypothetical protein [Myxococcales bacterium]